VTGPVHSGLRVLLASAAAEAGFSIDVEHVLRQLAATVRGFERRRAAPEPIAVATRRRRLRRALRALADLGDVAALQPSPDERAGWSEAVCEMFARAQSLLATAERPARRGGRRDDATRALVLEVAWILSGAGFPLSSYEGGVLATVSRAVITLAGRRLPEGENVRRLLRPAVRFCRRQGVMESTSGERFNDLTERLPTPSSSRSNATH
jgi:hypothetical protein